MASPVSSKTPRETIRPINISARGSRGPTVPHSETLEVSVVVTAYNESESLRALYDDVASALSGRRWELIVVDDGSRDKTYEVAAELQAVDKRVKVIHLRRNFGKTAALSAGLWHARGSAVVTMDADLQDDPHEVPGMLNVLDSGYDLVVGWRRDRRDPLSKRISSALFNGLVSRLTALHLHDMNCGLKACRAEVARSLKLYGELHRFVPVLASQQGYRVGEIVVTHRPRLHGHSKYGWTRAVSALFDIQTVLFLTRYLNRPLRLFGSGGLLLLGMGVGFGAYLSALHFLGQDIGHRPLLLLSVLLVLSGFNLLSTGLIGEMLRNVSFRRQDEYSIDAILDEEAKGVCQNLPTP